jgi:hypothetical protein
MPAPSSPGARVPEVEAMGAGAAVFWIDWKEILPSREAVVRIEGLRGHHWTSKVQFEEGVTCVFDVELVLATWETRLEK